MENMLIKGYWTVICLTINIQDCSFSAVLMEQEKWIKSELPMARPLFSQRFYSWWCITKKAFFFFLHSTRLSFQAVYSAVVKGYLGPNLPPVDHLKMPGFSYFLLPQHLPARCLLCCPHHHFCTHSFSKIIPWEKNQQKMSTAFVRLDWKFWNLMFCICSCIQS